MNTQHQASVEHSYMEKRQHIKYLNALACKRKIFIHLVDGCGIMITVLGDCAGGLFLTR